MITGISPTGTLAQARRQTGLNTQIRTLPVDDNKTLATSADKARNRAQETTPGTKAELRTRLEDIRALRESVTQYSMAMLHTQGEVALREQSQEQVANRAESSEEIRARRIRASVEARDVRQSELPQGREQLREQPKRTDALRFSAEVRERARRLQDEALSAQRREATRLQPPIPDNPHADAWFTDAGPTVEFDTINADTPFPGNMPPLEDLLALLREEVNILEMLLGDEILGAELSSRQLSAELNNARSSFSTEAKRSAWQLSYHQPAFSRLGNFIDLIS